MTAELLTNAIIGSVLENMEMETLIKSEWRIPAESSRGWRLIWMRGRLVEVGGDIMNVLNGATDEASIDRVAM